VNRTGTIATVSPDTRAGMVLTLFVVAVLALAAVTAPAARSHGELVDTDPRDGTTLAEPPTEVRLEFSEPVTPELVTVRDAGGGRVDDDDLDVTRTEPVIGVSLPADLAPGSYEVTWSVRYADGHHGDGTFAFAVSEPDDAATDPDPLPGEGDEPDAGAPEELDDLGAPAPDDDDGAGGLAVVIIVVVALLAAAGAAVALSRRNRGGEPG
jgi:copper resistance protein C